MTEEKSRRDIKVTDHRHFAPTGERRREQDASEEDLAPGGGSAQAGADAQAQPRREAPSRGAGEGAPRAETAGAAPPRGRAGTAAPQNLSEFATGLVSSFSLLVARLAQETEIYLGLVPYPGKTEPEPDLEAARAMIDMLSMLEEKTKGNLDQEESRLLADLIYTYRLEFVRRAPGGGVAP